MNSGIKVNTNCAHEFEKMKMQKSYRYIIFKISDDLKEIEVEECAPRDATYEDMRSTLVDQTECRYAACDLEFEGASGQARSKLAFITWTPGSAKSKPKMVYACSQASLKKALQLDIEVPARDAEGLDIANAIERVRRGMRD